MRERASALIIRDKKLLLVSGHNSDGYWTPGGRIEQNETPQECLIRELKEELGIDVKDIKYYDEYQKNNAFTGELQRTRCYLVSAIGEPKPSSEITQMIWIDANTAANISKTFRDKIIARLVAEKLM